MGLSVVFVVVSIVLSDVFSQDCLGASSRCVSLYNCPALLNAFAQQPLPERVATFLKNSQCGLDGNVPRVFCRPLPEQESETPTQSAEARDIKFTQTLSEPLSIGAHVVYTGTPSEEFPWFTVNIGTGDPYYWRGDIAVHFSVRLPQQEVVRNTLLHDEWGVQETTTFRLFPFKMDRPFTIEVLVEKTETLLAVDGEHCCSFSHRNPSPFAANWVQVTGVRNATLRVGKTDVYPTLAPPPLKVPLRPSVDSALESLDASCWRPNVIASLSNGIPEGHQIVIRGRLQPLLHSFTIDLMDAAHEWPYPNVHVHVNVRADEESQKDRQLVVLNAWFGAWGPELRQHTRLVPGDTSMFRIVRGDDGEWSIYSDNVLIGELKNRAAPADVKALRIRGDFYPDDVYICPASSSPTGEAKTN